MSEFEEKDLYFEEQINEEVEQFVVSLANKIDLNKYVVYKFSSNTNIEIIYSSLNYNNCFPFRSTNYIRHLLSIYPLKENLCNVEKIIFRPRYFCTGSVELAALFLKKEKILVEYFHHPHLYEAKSEVFPDNDDYDFSLMADGNRLGTGVKTDPIVKIPSTLYYIFLSSQTEHNDIDKYFINVVNFNEKEIENDLYKKSEFYFNHGY